MFLPFFGMLLAHLEKQVKPDKNLLLEAPPSVATTLDSPFLGGAVHTGSKRDSKMDRDSYWE